MRSLVTALLAVVVLVFVGCKSPTAPDEPPGPSGPSSLIVWKVEYVQSGLRTVSSAGGVYLSFHGESSVARSGLPMTGTPVEGSIWTWEGDQELLELVRDDGITNVTVSDTFRPVGQSNASYPIKVSIWRDGQMLSSATSSSGTVWSIGGGRYAAKFFFRTMEQVELVQGPGIPQ